jgi:hypothetical protein
MRALAMVVAVGCVSCVDTQAAKGTHAASSADAGLDAADSWSGPVKPPTAPASGPGAAPVPSLIGAVAGSAGAHAAGAGTSARDSGSAGSSSPPIAIPPSGSQLPAAPPTAAPRTPMPSQVGQLVITEIMVDPKTLSDTEGEWFELKNITNGVLDLQGCMLDDGAKQPHSIAAKLLVQPQGYATIARNDHPGFKPSYVETLSFTNTADVIALRCGDLEIDRVAYDKAAGFPVLAGASLSLDRDSVDAQANDRADSWCAGSQSYGPELGTPGAPNPACPTHLDAGTAEE